jgi:hypothetical protein
MFSNDDHPENRMPKEGKSMEFLRKEREIARLANHTANLTEHMLTLTDLIKTLSMEIMMQKRAFNHLKELIIRASGDDDDDDDYFETN